MIDDLINFMGTDAREPRFPGMVYATVTRVENGEYMVQPTSSGFSAELGPARLATMMSGDRYGTFFGPVVGDEVVVGFELGNPARPVILGALWNPDRQPPDQADQSQDNNRRTLVSRSKHELTFDDSPTGTRITLKSSGGYQIIIEDGPTPRLIVKTTGSVATSTLVLDGVMWNHQHATGVGPSGPPLSVIPAAPEALLPEDQ
jgi:hypothetical protein